MPPRYNERTPTAISTLAGKPAPRELLTDLVQLERKFYEDRPEANDPNQRVPEKGSLIHGKVLL